MRADLAPARARWRGGVPALVALLAFALLMLAATRIPLFHSPDALAHIARADMLAHGQWMLEPAPPGQPARLGGSGGRVDENLYAIVLQVFEHLQTGKADLARFRAIDASAAALGWSGNTHYVPASGTGYYFPALYLPHAAALWTARQLGLSMASSYWLMTGTTLALCLALLVAAWRIRPPSLLVIAIVATPMALFQILSPTLDGIAICLAVLAMQLYLRLLDAPPGARDGRQALLFALCAFLLISVRTNLLPLLALLFLLAWRKPSRALWAVAIGLAAATLGWTLFALTTTIDTRIERAHGSAELVGLYLREPGLFLQLLWRTLGDGQMPMFYLHSFFGVLGWLDAPIARPLLFTLVALLVALLMTQGAVTLAQPRHRPPGMGARRPGDTAVILAVAAASGLLVFAALAVTWNDHPAAQILGVQGRYFLLPAIVAASLAHPAVLLAPGTSAHPAGRSEMALRGLLGVYLAVSAYALIGTLQTYYH